MSDDLIRLLDEEGSDLLRSLISAGREEEPTSAALQRTLAAVGAGIALSAAASALSVPATASTLGGAGSAAVGLAERAASSMLVLIGKWLAVGVAVGTVASSAAYSFSVAEAPQTHQELATAQVPSKRLVATPAPRTAPALPEAPAPVLEIVPSARVAALPPFAIGTRAAVEPKADPGLPLAAEVAALDRARQALASNDAGRALELLSGYEMRFPEARMLPEALYLRLEAFNLSGDKPSAESVARRILHAYPGSPHAARARTALGIEH